MGRVISAGIVFIIGVDGKLLYKKSEFSWNPDVFAINLPVVYDALTPNRPIPVFGLEIGYDMIQELKANTTDRAKKHQQVLFDLYNAKTVEARKNAAKEAVELAACWYPLEVRGPVDIAYLSSDGVQWPQRKQVCTDSSVAVH